MTLLGSVCVKCLEKRWKSKTFFATDGSRWLPTRSISYNPTYLLGAHLVTATNSPHVNSRKKTCLFWEGLFHFTQAKRDDSKLDLETIGWRGPTKRWGILDWLLGAMSSFWEKALVKMIVGNQQKLRELSKLSDVCKRDTQTSVVRDHPYITQTLNVMLYMPTFAPVNYPNVGK